MLSLLAKIMAKFVHEYTYKFGDLFSIKKKRAMSVLDSKKFLQLGASRSALGGANNVFKVKRLFSDRKRGCDRATSPLYEPRVHLRFEI